jgi:hypothetical protein
VTAEGRQILIQRGLFLWTLSWFLLLVCLLSAWPSDAFFRVWVGKLCISVFGLTVGFVATRGQLRWQRWVWAPAVLLLALQVLLASLLWLTSSDDSQGFLANLLSHISVRPLVVAAYLHLGSYVGAARYAFEQLVMPVLQLAALAAVLIWWRESPSNSTPHPDARGASHLG